MKSRHIKYYLVVGLLITMCAIGTVTTTAEPTVELLETKITAHEDTPIIMDSHALRYIVIQGDTVFGVPV